MDLAALGALSLSDSTGTKYELGDLWADPPVVLVFLRHFGCLHCREHAVSCATATTSSKRRASTSSRSAPATSAMPARSSATSRSPTSCSSTTTRRRRAAASVKRRVVVPVAAPAHLARDASQRGSAAHRVH